MAQQKRKIAKAVVEQMAYNQAKAHMKSVISMCNQEQFTQQETREIVQAVRSGFRASINHDKKETTS